MSYNSFLTELFDRGRWSISFLRTAAGEARRWPVFGFIRCSSHPPCCFPWLPLRYPYMILSTLRDCYQVTIKDRKTIAECYCDKVINIQCYAYGVLIMRVFLNFLFNKINQSFFLLFWSDFVNCFFYIWVLNDFFSFSFSFFWLYMIYKHLQISVQ